MALSLTSCRVLLPSTRLAFELGLIAAVTLAAAPVTPAAVGVGVVVVMLAVGVLLTLLLTCRCCC